MKILILYYSFTGNVYRMSKFVAEGVEEGGGTPVVKTVPELVPAENIEAYGLAKQAKAEQANIPVATPEELPDYAGIIIGTPTRYGNMASQMRNFWDQTGALWMKGALVGKPAGVFTSTGTLHGGQETTIVSTMMTLFHHGMVVVGVPYSVPEMLSTNMGGTPYGPSHVAGNPPTNTITYDESAICKALGRRVAEIATKLAQ